MGLNYRGLVCHDALHAVRYSNRQSGPDGCLTNSLPSLGVSPQLSLKLSGQRCGLVFELRLFPPSSYLFLAIYLWIYPPLL